VGGQAAGAVATVLSAFDAKVAAVLGGGGPRSIGSGPAEPTITSVSGDIGALYAELDRADATPTAAQATARAEIEKSFVGVMSRWTPLLKTDLPALNQQLRGANLPEIHVEAGSPEQAESEDIE